MVSDDLVDLFSVVGFLQLDLLIEPVDLFFQFVNGDFLHLDFAFDLFVAGHEIFVLGHELFLLQF